MADRRAQTAAQRQAARRARLRAEGGRQVLVTLHPEQARRLDALPTPPWPASDAGKIARLIDSA